MIRKSRKGLKCQRGFTMVEVLVAMLLIVIGIFAVIGMQLAALRADSHAHQLSVATSMAQQELEDIMSWDPSDARIDVADGGPYNYFPDPANPANNFITIPGAGTFATTFNTLRGTSTNGITTGVTRVVVMVNYGNNSTVTITGFKRMT